MPRVLDNWLHSFLDWTLPRSEAPESYIIWSGLFTIASVAKRKVCFPKSIMGSYTIYPNIYVFFVGPAGGPRKSTTLNYAESLLMQMDDVKLSSTGSSASKMIETLSETPDGSIAIVSSEFATFINVTPDEMYDLLIDLYDGKIKLDYATRMHGLEIVEEPCVNLFTATTPEWISNAMPAHVIGGGFASRVIFVYENKVRHRVLYYNLDWRTFIDLEQQLVYDLGQISEAEGEFKHDKPTTRDAMEEWYRDTADDPVPSEKIEAYFHRKPVHIHKVAMLLSLAESNDLVITLKHFEAAKTLLETVEVKMPRVFSAVGKNPYSADVEKILDHIEKAGRPVLRHELMSRFYYDMTPEAMGGVLETLVIMDAIVMTKGQGVANATYTIKTT